MQTHSTFPKRDSLHVAGIAALDEIQTGILPVAVAMLQPLLG